MQIAAAYIASLVIFLVFDGIWLSVMGNLVYRPTLGDILLTNLRIAPALVFYAAFPVGIVAFVVMPALKAGGAGAAVTYGLLFGAIAYATYDLTNYATLRNWTLQLTIMDIVYGAIVTAATAVAGTYAARLAASWG
jgi:uncharacterized membrane protein